MPRRGCGRPPRVRKRGLSRRKVPAPGAGLAELTARRMRVRPGARPSAATLAACDGPGLMTTPNSGAGVTRMTDCTDLPLWQDCSEEPEPARAGWVMRGSMEALGWASDPWAVALAPYRSVCDTGSAWSWRTQATAGARDGAPADFRTEPARGLRGDLYHRGRGVVAKSRPHTRGDESGVMCSRPDSTPGWWDDSWCSMTRGLMMDSPEAVAAARELSRSDGPQIRAFGESVVDTQSAQIEQMTA